MHFQCDIYMPINRRSLISAFSFPQGDRRRHNGLRAPSLGDYQLRIHGGGRDGAAEQTRPHTLLPHTHLGAGTSPLTDGAVRPELGRSSRGPGRSPRRKFCL